MSCLRLQRVVKERFNIEIDYLNHYLTKFTCSFTKGSNMLMSLANRLPSGTPRVAVFAI